MSTKHKSINPDTIDFSSTSLDSGESFYRNLMTPVLSETDIIEWYYTTGESCVSIQAGNLGKWIEANNLHVPQDMEAHECDSLKWLDDNFESATKDYFMAVYAIEESEVGND